MAPAYTRRVEAAVAVMERSPEKTLELQFQSAVENQNATLPPLQSEQEGSAECGGALCGGDGARDGTPRRRPRRLW